MSLFSNISSTKLSVDAAFRHYFGFKLIYQPLQFFGEKSFKTGVYFKMIRLVLSFKLEGITKE